MNNINRFPKKIGGCDFSLKVGCRLDCRYCPQELFVSSYFKKFGLSAPTELSFENFCRLLNKVEPGSGICFAGMTEPFLNKDCSKMIRYAYEKGYKIHLDTTFQGATIEDIDYIKEVKFSDLQFHILDQERHSKFIIDESYLEVVEKAKELFPFNSYHCHGKVHSEVERYIEEQKVSYDLHDRAGNIKIECVNPSVKKGPIVCVGGSITVVSGSSPVILPNGAVVRCCMDFGLRHVYGNLLEQDWDEIVAGQEYQQYEKGLEDETVSSLCRTCSGASMDVEMAYSEVRFFQPNAIKAARILEMLSRDSSIDVPNKHIWMRILQAKEICIFGAGKLFQDNYCQSSWHDVIPAEFVLDNDESKYGKIIGGLECMPPEKIRENANILVVTYCMDDVAIRKQLILQGNTNILNIVEIVDATRKVKI